MSAAISRAIPVSTWLFAISALAALIACIDIVDFVELPFESAFNAFTVSNALTGLVSLMFTLGYVGLFFLMFLENVSLPIPSELVLPLAGYLIYTGRMNFPLALSVATLAGISGGLVAYWIALLLGRPLVYGFAKRLGVNEEKMIRSEEWLSGKGSIIIFIARFVPGIRSSISLPAGVLKMNLWRFSIMTLLGSFGWSFLLIYIGFSTGRLWQSGASELSSAIMYFLPYAVLGFSIFYLAYYSQSKIISSLRRG